MNEWSDRIEVEKLNFDLSEFKKLSDSLLSECQRLIKEKQKDLLKSVDFSTFNDFLGQIFNRLDFATYNENVVDFNSKVDLL